jgi:hypothetical protein
LPIDVEVVVKIYDSPESIRIKNRIEEQKLSIRNKMKDIAANDDKIKEFSTKLNEINTKIDGLKMMLKKPTENNTELVSDFY